MLGGGLDGGVLGGVPGGVLGGVLGGVPGGVLGGASGGVLGGVDGGVFGGGDGGVLGGVLGGPLGGGDGGVLGGVLGGALGGGDGGGGDGEASQRHAKNASSEARRPWTATAAAGHKQASTVAKMCANSGSHARALDTDRAVKTPLSSSWHTTSTASASPAAARSAATAPSTGMVSPGATVPYSSANAWQAVSEMTTSDDSKGSDKAHAKPVAKSAAGSRGVGGGGGALGAVWSSDVTKHCVAWSWI